MRWKRLNSGGVSDCVKIDEKREEQGAKNEGWVSPLIRKSILREGKMKGNEKIIEKLNDLLADELTAINQYIVHAEMCANWMYEKLHKADEKRAVDEMKHAEKLIARILFLEGRPIVNNLKKITIGAEVEAQHKNDWAAEDGAIKSYNEGIKKAVELGDNGTRELLESILKDEEAHIDWLEAQLDQIKQMGIQNYLVEQTN
jgi:bacterioferritin